MDILSGGCRLCLDPYVEGFTTIDSPELKDQMEKVFRFSIEPKEGYCSDVCQSCSYTISEFYEYSEKVRQNQNLLEGNVTDLTDVDSKASFECIKVDAPIDSMLSETTEIIYEPKEELSGEEEGPDFGDDDLCKSSPNNLETNRKRGAKIGQQERDEQDQLFNQHFSMDCDLCGMSAGTFSELTNHFRKEHKRCDGYVVCCNKKFFRRRDIRGHIEVHSNPNLFRCEVCGHKCSTNIALNAHMLIKHSSESQIQSKGRLEKASKQERDEQDRLFNQHFSMDCDLCGLPAGTFSELSRHFRTEHKRSDGYVVCCNKKLFKRYDIRDHIELHANPDLFRCQVCGHRCNNKVALNTHMLNRHSSEAQTQQKERLETDESELQQQEGVERSNRSTMTKQERDELDQLFNAHFSMVCDLCGVSTETFTELSRHFRTQHKRSDGYVVCCNKKLFKRYDIRDHIEFHTNPDLFRCKVCGHKCNNKVALNTHMLNRHSSEAQTQRKERLETDESELQQQEEDDERSNRSAMTKQERDELDQLFNAHFRMVCDLCGVSTETFTELRRHFRTQHKRSDGYVVCCNKKLFKRNDIRDHIEFHTNPDLFRCEVCGNKYQSKITLNTHVLRKHLAVDQDPVQCDHCPKIFADKFALSQHKKRIVEYKCPKCDKMLTGRGSLRRHMAHQHEGKKRSLVCDTCGKEFLSPQNFKVHINKHKGINQRVQCEICQKWLKGNGSLRSHMKFVHTDKLDFQCDLCPEKFPHNRALTLHKFHVHTDKTHECEFCGRTFKKAISLKEHRANHMGKALHSCKYCGIPKRSLTQLYRHIKLEHPIEWAQKKIKAAKRRVNKESIPKVD